MARKLLDIQNDRIKSTGESPSIVKRDLVAKTKSAGKSVGLLDDTELEYKGNYPSVFKKIDPSDFKKEEFVTNKLFMFVSGSATSSALPLEARYSNRNSLPALGSELTYNDASNIDGSLQSITYFSIDHLYYKRKGEPANTFGPTDLTRTKKFLYESASVFVIPQNKIGEGIKPASFQFTSSVLLSADRYGNVIDGNFDSASIITNVQFYEGFNEYFDTNRIQYISHSGITYVDGVPTTDGDTLPIGRAASFDGSGHFQTSIDGYYDRQHDYAISFFLSGSNNGGDDQIILTKQKQNNNKYPFKIQLSGSNDVKFSISSDSILNATVATTSSLSGWKHILCQKSGSEMSIWVDAVKHVSSSYDFLLYGVNSIYTASGKISNDDPLNVGGYSPNSSNLMGDLDEIRIFNKSLSQAQISSLADRTEDGTFLQTNHVGNVFPKHGTIVISSPHYKYGDLTKTAYTASYRSTLTTTEYSTLVRISKDDFNLTLNPSTLQDNGVDYDSYVSSSDFDPYITTIGLYNDAGQLLVTGKLASPLRKRGDIDMNILLRFDADL